jgi:hypothetical protein
MFLWLIENAAATAICCLKKTGEENKSKTGGKKHQKPLLND